MTTAIEDTVETLRKELDDILKKYQIPMDDRGFVIEKVEDAINGIMKIQHGVFSDKLGEIREDLSAEREKVHSQVEGLKKAAAEKIADAHDKIGQAYEKGASDGAKDAESNQGPSTLNIVLAIFFAALAFVVVAGMVFGKGDTKGKKKG